MESSIEITLGKKVRENPKAQSNKAANKEGLSSTLDDVKFYFHLLFTHKRFLYFLRGRSRNGYRREYEEEMLKEVEWAKKYGKRYKSAREGLAYHN